MANAWTTQRAGNWSLASDNASSPWHDGGAQTALAAIPAATDTVHLAHEVAMDSDVVPASGTLDTLDATGGALAITMGENDKSLSALTIRGGTVDLITVTGDAPTKTLTVTCTDIQAGTTTGADALYHNSTAGLTFVGNVLGSGGNNRGLKLHGNATYSLTGDITGGTAQYAYGVEITAGTMTHEGSITGGSTAGPAYGVYQNGGDWTTNGASSKVIGGTYSSDSGFYLNAGTATINVPVFAGTAGTCHGILAGGTGPTLTVNADIEGNTQENAYAVYVRLSTADVTLTGNILYTAGKSSPIGGFSPKWAPSLASKVLQLPTTGETTINAPQQLAAENVKIDVVHGSITGTYEGAGSGGGGPLVGASALVSC